MDYADRYARLEDRSDISLVRELTYGSKEALEELTRRYLGVVSRTTFRILCDRIDSEQVTVQVFASVWHDVLDYDDKYTVEEWILRKTCLYSRIRIMRRRILRIFGVINDVFVRVSPKAENEDDYVTKQAWQLHCRATTHMTPLQSMVYALCVLECIPQEKVATITGMTGFRIGVAMNRAEDKVRAELKDYGKTDYYDSYNDFLRKVADSMTDMAKLNKMIIFAV